MADDELSVLSRAADAARENYNAVFRGVDARRDAIRREWRRATCPQRRKKLDEEFDAENKKLEAANDALEAAKAALTAALRTRGLPTEGPLSSPLRAWQEKEAALKNLIELYKWELD